MSPVRVRPRAKLIGCNKPIQMKLDFAGVKARLVNRSKGHGADTPERRGHVLI